MYRIPAKAQCTVFLMVRKCLLGMGGGESSIPYSKKLDKVIKSKNKSRGAGHVLKNTGHKKYIHMYIYEI